MSYVDLDSLQRAVSGTIVSHEWCDQVNDNDAYFKTQTDAINTSLGYLHQIEVYQSAVYRSAALSIPNSTDTLLQYDTVVRDDGAMYSLSTHLWTIPVSGWWDLLAQVAFLSASAQGYTGIYINGVLTYTGNRVPLAGVQGPTIAKRWPLNAGTTVGIDAWQDSGSSTSIYTGAFQTNASLGLVVPFTL